MSTGLSGLIGVDIGAVLGDGLAAATSIFQANTQLQIAQANLAAQAAADNSAQAIANSNSANVNLLITGGLVLAGGVLAIRALRKR